MTLREIQRFIAAVDPSARRYFHTESDVDYTTWHEIRRLPVMGAGRHAEEAWRFQIDRFTRHDGDPVCGALEEALEASPRITWSHQSAYEPDTGYIHHIYTCEAI